MDDEPSSFAAVWREASREQWAAWRSITEPPDRKGPEPVSGDFRVTLAELGISGEDEIIDFYRFTRDTAQRAAGGGMAARGGPVVDFMTSVTACLKAGGQVTVKPRGMTWNEMQGVTAVLRAALTRTALDMGACPRHVRVAARRLAEAWEAFSGTKPDPRSPREKRLAWGDEHGWIDF